MVAAMVGSGLSGKDLHIDCLLQIVRESSKLFLSVSSPQWENTRGYLFDPETRELYFRDELTGTCIRKFWQQWLPVRRFPPGRRHLAHPAGRPHVRPAA
jgi:hypothetical protein